METKGYSKSAVNYFWERYKKGIKDWNILSKLIAIIFTGLFLFLIIFNILSLISNFNITYLSIFCATITVFVPIPLILSFIGVAPSGLHEFNIITFYKVWLIPIVIMVGVSPFILSVAPVFSSLFLGPIMWLFIFYVHHQRISGPGVVYLHGIMLLRDIKDKNFGEKDVIYDLSKFLCGWDDWIAKIRKLHIKNLDEWKSDLLRELLITPGKFRQDISNLLDPEFFKLIKNENDSEITSRISKLSGILLNPTPEGFITSLKRQSDAFSIAISIFTLIYMVIILLDYII